MAFVCHYVCNYYLGPTDKVVGSFNLELGEVWMPLVWLAPYARIVHWFNTGVAFGLLQELGKYSMIFSILVVALIMYYFPKYHALIG